MNHPSTVRIKNHEGIIIECRCLPCSARQEFLRWRDSAWKLLQEDELAARSKTAEMGIQHLFDSSEEFRWLCSRMLAAHGLSMDSLDIFQVIELLFLSGEKEDGVLVKLQFPPIPPGNGKKVEDGEDPYYSLWASLAYSSGNWLQAKETLDTLTYEEIIQVSGHLERLSNQQKTETPKPAHPVSNAKQELVRQQARDARQRGMEEGVKERQLAAIRKAIEERNAKSNQPD